MTFKTLTTCCDIRCICLRTFHVVLVQTVYESYLIGCGLAGVLLNQRSFQQPYYPCPTESFLLLNRSLTSANGSLVNHLSGIVERRDEISGCSGRGCVGCGHLVRESKMSFIRGNSKTCQSTHEEVNIVEGY